MIIKSILIFLIFSTVLSRSLLGENIDSLIVKQNDIAIQMLKEGKYEEAETQLIYVLDLKSRYWPDDYVNLGNSYTNLGSVQTLLFKMEQALTSYDKAEASYNKTDKQRWKIAGLLNNEAVLLMAQWDYSKAFTYLKKSLSYFDQSTEVSTSIKITIYGNLGLIYAYLGNIEESNRYMELVDSMDPLQHASVLSRVYRTFTNEKIYKDNFRLAQFYFDRRKSLIERSPILAKNSLFIVSYYLDYANFLSQKLGRTKEAFQYFRKAEQIAIKEFNPGNPLFIELYNYFALTFISNKNYDAALENLQKVIILSSKDFNNSSISSNPSENQILNDRTAYKAFKQKSNILFNQFIENKNLTTLNNSLDAFLIGIRILNRIRLRINSENSQFLISSDEKNIYFTGQQIAVAMFNITKDEKYKNLAFQINEQGRAFSLLSSIRSKTALTYGNVPYELTKKESELNQKISAYNEMILDEKQKLQPEEKKVILWEGMLFDYTRDYDELIKFIEKNYPEYFRLKYDNSVISMDEVREKIPEKSIIVEYSMMDTILYTYLISKEKSVILEQKIDSSLALNCNRFYEVMTKQNFSYDVRDTYRDYAILGHEIYEKIFAPLESYIGDKEVIVIPDGAISYVPFEAMLTRAVDPEKPDYYSVPFLIYDHAFSTSYSSTLHFSEMPRHKDALQEILAFAPSYGNLTSYNPGFELLRQSDLDELVRIPGVKQEVEKISKEMKCKVFQDVNATETNFKNNASGYKILHLAMHTILDDDNPLYSKLAFTQGVDTINDGFLHTYEIYDLKLNANLAVLSSCGSGYGRFQEGEGMQSLARGFTYAGCPSILMTLWEVADQSTVSVMDRFYYYLGHGQSKSEALRNSKLDFLANADQLKSNPFFWSSFVIIGNSEPVYPGRIWNILLNIGILLVPVPLIYILYRKYRKDATMKVA